jgi:hypothetical protein
MTHPLIAALQPGFHYFPLAAGSKKPAFTQSWKELSTTRLDQIEDWVEEGFNLAVDTEKSNLIVVDCDGEEGMTAWIELSTHLRPPTPATLTVTTPHGMHIYFHGSAPSSAGRLAKGLDIRSRGGYVVAPGSTVDGIEYAISC